MQNLISINAVNDKYRDAIIGLLQSEKLPVEDLPADLKNFFVAIDNGSVVGAIGLEVYDQNGLLRSLIVKSEYRKMKLATRLINELENLSRSIGLKSIYLLTETAREYFDKKGYTAIDRNKAPVSIKQSSEFSHVCPSTAVLMQKNI